MKATLRCFARLAIKSPSGKGCVRPRWHWALDIQTYGTLTGKKSYVKQAIALRHARGAARKLGLTIIAERVIVKLQDGLDCV